VENGNRDFQSRLLKRARRLARLVKMAAPPILIAKGIEMVTESALDFYGKELESAMGHIKREKAIIKAGYCLYCGASGASGGICAACGAALEEQWGFLEKEEGGVDLEPAPPSDAAIH